MWKVNYLPLVESIGKEFLNVSSLSGYDVKKNKSFYSMLGCLRNIICIFVTVNLQDNKIINLKKKKYAY